MHQPIKTVFVTDVPFWKRESGAQMRIDQLVENLSVDPFQVSTLLTQAPRGFDLNNVDCRTQVELLDPSTPPKSGFWRQMRWQISAIANSLGWKAEAHVPTFENYYPKAFVQRFLDFVLMSQPDVLVCEYATQTQLVRSLPDSVRNRLVTVLDTHDVLWKRAVQFKQQGHEHWIGVDQAAEEAAIGEYDLVMAIQSEEANYFKSLVGDKKVIVTSMEFDDHVPAGAPNPTNPSVTEEQTKSCETSNRNKLVIGYLASNNWTNVDAAQQILNCWPSIAADLPNIELVIAGSVCDSETITDDAQNMPRCRILGRVNSIDDFYGQIDVVWNPVRFGTGLKIKNLEALSYAKCLVTSPHGIEGIGGNSFCNSNDQDSDHGPIVVLDTAGAMKSFLSGRDSSLINTLGQSGQKHLKKHFGPGTQYPALRQKLGSFFSRKTE